MELIVTMTCLRTVTARRLQQHQLPLQRYRQHMIQKQPLLLCLLRSIRIDQINRLALHIQLIYRGCQWPSQLRISQVLPKLKMTSRIT